MLEPIFTPEQIDMLNTPLQPSEIEPKTGMSYLKGQLAVIKANAGFGYGNWGYEQIGPIEMIETVTSNNNSKKVILVTAMVKVTVRGCISFVEQGDCEAQGEGYASLSMARKGAVTDGLKRCLKNFGPCFGLELYFKTPPVQAASQPTQNRPAQTPQRPQESRNVPQPPSRPAPAQIAPNPVTTAKMGNPKEDDYFIYYSDKFAKCKTVKDLEGIVAAMKAEVYDPAILALLRVEYSQTNTRLTNAARALEGALN